MENNHSEALVLVVDDDSVARRLVTRLLQSASYKVVAAASAEEAEVALLAQPPDSFFCIVTDYQMPGLNGVEFLACARIRDPNIGAILVTAEGEQHVVEQSLRGGFADFLNKPVARVELLGAVEKAVASTRRMRSICDMTRSVEQAGLTQKRLHTSEIHKGLLSAHVYARPIHQAGGDFFSHILVSPTEEVVLIADISGHDLSAAYISAYFQGMVRGMVESGNALPAVFDRFNRFLIEESNTQPEEGTSISACGLHYDAALEEVNIVSCGPPLAIFTSASGDTESACHSTAYPLGWFADNPITATRHSFADGEIVLWTDGLSDLAAILNADPLSLIHSLLAAKPGDREPRWLSSAADDIMAARIQLWEKPQMLHTILDEAYGPEQEANIDALQAYWKNSMMAAMCDDEMDTTCPYLYDATLCAREALLNALHYGCAAGQTARFQVSCSADQATLRIRVSDPGPGHHFDYSARDNNTSELFDLHRGLSLIQALSGRLTTSRNGAELIMDFFWER